MGLLSCGQVRNSFCSYSNTPSDIHQQALQRWPWSSELDQRAGHNDTAASSDHRDRILHLVA